MDKPNWTADQQKVIDLRNRNILVSAAAGSGKTAVLVERIIQIITDETHPVDIDRLLVVTFTRAAAGEMRRRISDALEKQLLQTPDNEYLQKQASLLHHAQIATIDSFCQNIVKNYFHVINLDPVFRVADESDLSIMKSELLQELLEDRYEKKETSFLRFVDTMSPGRTDSAVEELVLHLHRISMSYPWPMDWLAQVESAYQCTSLQELEESPWVTELTAYIRQMVQGYLGMAREAEKICQEDSGPGTYLDAIQSDLRQLEMVSKAQTYRELYGAFAGLNKATLSRKKSDADPDKKEQVKVLREGYFKNGLESISKDFFFQSPEEMLQDLQYMQPVMEELVSLTIDFITLFDEKKREEGLVDFSDLEHFALQILVEKDADGSVQPSDTARELQEYYEEILTDEYQDSNFIQELILTSLCRAPEKPPYMFMVGDVKQSIYQFRLARPELFTKKYNGYSVEDGKEQRIDLHQNFRSRAIVLESANYLFCRIMQSCLGGIVYDEAASLVPGAEFETSDLNISTENEMLLIDRKTEMDDSLDKIELEASTVGQRIKELVQGSDPLYVKGKGGYRPAEYRDIVILLRSPGSWIEEFLQVLTDMGIPAYSETKTGYFSTLEVETILNLLRIIDNPRQDIPMAAVLRSCLTGLSDDELAYLAALPRSLNYQDGICEVLAMSSEQMQSFKEEHKVDLEPLQQKLSVFLDRLSEYHAQSQFLSVYQLLRKIYRETGYYALMSAMPAGEKRAANLDILLQQAVQFAENGHRGIFAFCRYIESLHKSNIDFGEAMITNENTNAVRIISIHKSKGLEFPIVFVSGLGKQFNLQDARKSTIIDADYGVGTDYMDLELRIKQPTLLKKYMAARIKQNTLAEEIRILYVALTRAKEKLILTGSIADAEKKLIKWGFVSRQPKLPDLLSVSTSLDWILPAILAPGGKGYYQLNIIRQEDLVKNEADAIWRDMAQYDQLMHWDDRVCHDAELSNLMQRQQEYVYPHEQDRHIPVKISVTELKRQEMRRMQEENEEELSDLIRCEYAQEQEPEELPRAKFLSGNDEVSGAQRGTLYHMIMEHLPYQSVDTVNDGSFLQTICECGYMTLAEKELLDASKFSRFLKTELGQRMYQAAQNGTLKREQPFMIGLPACEIYPEVSSTEPVLIQGIIDAYFTEGENIILVDYKTDHVASEDGRELVQKYHAQLEYYAKALESLTGKKVTEQIIYSFALDAQIRLS